MLEQLISYDELKISIEKKRIPEIIEGSKGR